MCSINMSYSTNVPGSSKIDRRSLAVSFPFSCWLLMRFFPPPSKAAFRFSSISCLTRRVFATVLEQGRSDRPETRRGPAKKLGSRRHAVVEANRADMTAFRVPRSRSVNFQIFLSRSGTGVIQNRSSLRLPETPRQPETPS